MIPLIGYVNQLSGRPGDTLQFKVSSTSKKPFKARLIRIRCADPNPEGPGIREDEINTPFEGEYSSQYQKVNIGSYGIVKNVKKLEKLKSYTLSVKIWPTLPIGKRQIIISWNNSKSNSAALGISKQGKLFGEIGQTKIGHNITLIPRTWYNVWFSYDDDNKTISISLKHLSPRNTIKETETTITAVLSASKGFFGPIIFAAEKNREMTSHFNGKIEQPQIFNSVVGKNNLSKPNNINCVASWDFSKDISSINLVDTSPSNLTGELINMPARAMTGSNWTGKEMSWRHAPEQYGAIHFHDDDLHDCNWNTSFEYIIPNDLPSGIYAAKISDGEHEDKIPFIVCPPINTRVADLCVIIPTFTYIVYANHARPNYSNAWQKRSNQWGAYPFNPADNRQFGLSTYNFHSDESGICNSSWLRPILTMRPGYFHFVDEKGSGLRHFQADTHIIDWLEEKELAYDLITDHELHKEGINVIKNYETVLTASHPEYHTTETLDALESYQNLGGRFIYLGGNGFYWKVALHNDENGVIEIRRGEGGIRAWAAEPGEYYNAFDGEYGGLWRRNGRPPQRIAGVGFSAQGTFVGSHYKRSLISYEEQFKWIFNNINDEFLGGFGLSGGGAAGFELDRADIRLGTPQNAIILASSEGHSRDFTGDKDDFFVLVPEEQLTHLVTWPGDDIDSLIRADIVLFSTANGGAVFSVGSITFCGSLPTNNYNNNISQLLFNVVTKFLDPKFVIKT